MAERGPTQSTGVVGRNNVVVQIVGDRNTVTPGYAHLTLTRYVTRRYVESDADLLSPYSRSIPLVGRDQEMADLRAWLSNSKRIAVRVVTGSAGSGKTRLALELCEAMIKEGWDAGFIEGGELVRFRNQQNLSTWGWQCPTLAVIDHSAARAEQMAGWLQELSDSPASSSKSLRLLLLERDAEVGAGWWQSAFGRGGWGARAVRKLLDPAEPVWLAPIPTITQRRAVLSEILGKKHSKVRPPEEGTDPAFDRRLSELSWGGEPLFLMMAGVLACDRGIGDALSLARTDLAYELADREIARIAEIASANRLDPDLVVTMAGHVTLCGGLHYGLLRAAVEAEKAALGLPSAGDPGKIAKVLRQCLPTSGARFAPILPDMIGEAVILRTLKMYDDGGVQAVHRAHKCARERVASMVVRLAKDYASHENDFPITLLNAFIEECSESIDDLVLINNMLCDKSLALADSSIKACAVLFFKLRSEMDAGREVSLEYYLGSIVNGPHHLMTLGEYGEALSICEEGIDLCREYGDRVSDHLATALMNYSVALNKFGRYEEAYAATKEAIEILRTLAVKEPEYYMNVLAMALDNASADLADLNRPNEGLAASEEAVEIFSGLAADHAEKSTRNLAMSLNNLGSRLGQLQRWKEAIGSTRRATELLRPVAAAQPDGCSTELIVALLNYACMLRASGEPQQAAERCAEAIETCLRLDPKHQTRLRAQLASCYSEFCECLGETNQFSKALQAADSSIQLFSILELQSPGAFGIELARVYSLRFVCLDLLGRPIDAIRAYHDSIAVLQPLFLKRPAAFADSISSRCEYYIGRCEELGLEPDAKLLLPICEALGRMEKGPSSAKSG